MDSVLKVVRFLPLLLLLGALCFLQVLSSEKEMFPFLVAYAALAAAALVAAAAGRLPQAAPRWWCLISTASFGGYLIVRALTSPVPYVARADLYLVLAALTIYVLVSTLLNTPRKRVGLVVGLLLFALVHVVIGATQVIRGGGLSLLIPALETFEQYRTAGRGVGLYVAPSHLAGMLEVVGALGLAIACWSRQPRWFRVCVGYFSATCYVGIIFSGSRGGYVSAAASVLLLAFVSLLLLAGKDWRKLLRFGAVGLALTSLVAGGFWMLLDDVGFGNKLARIADDPGRVDLWRAAIEQWKLQPWFGTGSGTYLFYGREFRAPLMQNDPVDVHNDYLHLLAEYGVAGAGAFLFFFLTHVRRGWLTVAALASRQAASGRAALSDRLALNIGALSALAAYVVHSAVDYNLHIPANALLVACAFGIIAAPGLPQRGRNANAADARVGLRVASAIPAALLLIQCIRFLPGEYFADRARRALWREDLEATVDAGLQALEHERQNPNVYFYLGRALRASAAELGTGEEQVSLYESAIAAFAKAHRLSPLDANYLIEQAQLYDLLGRFEEADRMFALAKNRDPRARYITNEYSVHQELWRQSGSQAAPTPAVHSDNSKK